MVQREFVEARLHVDFVMEICKRQHRAGRYFLHEHPWQASSWRLDSVSEVAGLDGVLKVQADQCQFDSEDVVSGNPVRKRTGFLTNSQCLADSLT